MLTETITPDVLARSVIAVPPLARNADFSINHAANRKMIGYLEAGGVSNILYGGNANFYHISSTQFREALQLLTESASEDTWMIPSVGPSFGLMMEQAEVLKEFDFPTAMVLPMNGMTTSDGVEEGFQRFVDVLGRPAILYIKSDGYIDPAAVGRLMEGGYVSAVKYATVRKEVADDPYLSELVDVANPKRIVSGIGEQPAVVHLRDFSLQSFTSGCVCIAPRWSLRMLKAIQSGRFEMANIIREQFDVLEYQRNSIHPIRVLHDAVSLVEIADMGSVLPLISNLPESMRERVRSAAKELLEYEQSIQVGH